MNLKIQDSIVNLVFRPQYLILIFLSVIQLFCSPEPQPIIFGNDQCTHCKMIISDMRYGAELVSNKGKIYKFDSVECLAAFSLSQTFAGEEIHSMWVINFAEPQALIAATTAVYLHSPQLPSPMGLNLSAFSERMSAQKLSNHYPGNIITWQDVQSLVGNEWINKKR
jgi:copper chaperone NosL